MNYTTCLKIAIVATLAVTFLSGCQKGDKSFSILGDGTAATQSPSYEVIPQKIDILWVVDNSGSMESSQTALTSNFQRFISKFQDQRYDFRMAVTTTDAYVGKFVGDNSLRRLKDGADGHHSNVFVMDRATSNLSNVFLTNATQGINGSGDERAFSSLEDVLTYNGNSDFRRSDAFLAVIIVSDEDDFSATTATYLNNNYASADLIPVSHYKTFLDSYAGAKNYNVNAITILDTACRDTLNAQSSGRRVGTRYIDLVNQVNAAHGVGGVKASLCANFGDSLQLISDVITNQKPANTAFKLDREPILSSIRVIINGNQIAQDAVNGWSYNATTWVVTLNGTAATTAQQAGASIQITYDPKNPLN